MLPPRGVSTAHQIQTKCGKLPNVISLSPTPNLKPIDKINWRRDEVSCFSTTTVDAINTTKPCRPGCLWYILLYYFWTVGDVASRNLSLKHII